jgi:hypothetical protein
MKEPSGRRWLVGAVALFLVLMVVWVAAAVRISASAAAPSSLMSSLRSRLSANYAPDAGGSSVRSLRLSIFQEVMQDLGLSDDEAVAESRRIVAGMQGPVPTATARDFEGAQPLTATPTKTPVPPHRLQQESRRDTPSRRRADQDATHRRCTVPTNTPGRIRIQHRASI